VLDGVLRSSSMVCIEAICHSVSVVQFISVLYFLQLDLDQGCELCVCEKMVFSLHCYRATCSSEVDILSCFVDCLN